MKSYPRKIVFLFLFFLGQKFQFLPKWTKCPLVSTGARDIRPWCQGLICGARDRFASGTDLGPDIGLGPSWGYDVQCPWPVWGHVRDKNLDLDKFWSSLGDWCGLESHT